MDQFEKILEVLDDESIQLARGFKDFLGTQLCMGMTNYVIENGVLSDGHEVLTDAARYFQANREMYQRSCEATRLQARAMECQADLIDAEDLLKNSETKSQILRAEAKIMVAKQSLQDALVTGAELKRQSQALNRVRLSLVDKVAAQYPLGYEQAEPDKWESVLKFRAIVGGSLTHVPIPMIRKAQLGATMGRKDAMAWLYVNNEKEAEKLIPYEAKTNVKNILP